MVPDQQDIFFILVVSGGPGAGEFVYDASGNLRSSNVGQPTTDPVQGISCPQGFATYNGHGAVLSLLSTTATSAGFFQYFDNGSAVQGSLILAIASTAGSDPVNATAYQAGVTGIDPVFGDSIQVVGVNINLSQGPFTKAGNITANTGAGATSPFIHVAGPEQTQAGHAVVRVYGKSVDGTKPGGVIMSLTDPPVRQLSEVLEVQGRMAVIGVTGHAALWYPPSGDTTGAADATALNSLLSAGHRVHLLPGTYYINAPVNVTGATLRGAGRNATTIQTGTGFAGTQMITMNRLAQIHDLTLAMPSATISTNPNADGILITQGGGFLHDITVKAVTFSQVNGWCVRISDDGTSGAPVGLWFIELTGSGSGGYGIFGGNRTMGAFFVNAGLGAVGGTSTTLDGLFAHDVFDLDFEGCWFAAASGTNTGHAIHLKGHVNAFRFVRAEIGGPGTSIAGSGSTGLLCEDDVNGQPSQITFIGINPFQGYDIGVSLQGTCFDIVFSGCEFNKNNTHGVVVNTTGVGIVFDNCKWAGPGAFASNGQAGPTLHGTYHDLHWQTTGHGRVANCEFGSSIVAVSSAGVQASVDFVAFAGVAVWLTDPLFTGSGSAAANQVINRPQYMRAPLITGTATLGAGGNVTVTAAYITAAMRIELRYLTPAGTRGAVFVSIVNPGASFTISSTSASDTSTIEYEVLL